MFIRNSSDKSEIRFLPTNLKCAMAWSRLSMQAMASAR